MSAGKCRGGWHKGGRRSCKQDTLQNAKLTPQDEHLITWYLSRCSTTTASFIFTRPDSLSSGHRIIFAEQPKLRQDRPSRTMRTGDALEKRTKRSIGVMSTTGERRRRVDVSWAVAALAAWLIVLASRAGSDARPAGETAVAASPRTLAMKAGHRETLALGDLKAGQTYRLLVTLESGCLQPEDRVRVVLEGAGTDRLSKALHAGDPDLYLPYRPSQDGQARLVLSRSQSTIALPLSVRFEWRQLTVSDHDRPAIEAEPNDSWQQASELRLGRDVYGNADELDYLDNAGEGKAGLDWFRFEVTGEKPILVYFQLDLLDRDVAVNLRVYAVDSKTGR
ncbi:MAG TPA: hypothetical protein VK217_02525, partial [Acidimicrobiales bacterium]|nr:hypothetical protein [Acidimicrobiales bacterium]